MAGRNAPSRVPGPEPPSPVTDDDWFLAAIDRVESAGLEAIAALGAGLAVLPPARADRRAGRPLPELAAAMVGRGSRQARVEASARLHAFERAVMLLRADLARHLIDDGLSMSEVAELFGVSRHMVARLARAGREGADRPAGRDLRP